MWLSVTLAIPRCHFSQEAYAGGNTLDASLLSLIPYSVSIFCSGKSSNLHVDILSTISTADNFAPASIHSSFPTFAAASLSGKSTIIWESRNSYCVPDLIHSSLLTNISPGSAHALLYNVNLSFSTGSSPSSWNPLSMHFSLGNRLLLMILWIPSHFQSLAHF